MLVELRDREEIAAWCGRSPMVNAYLLGDLDDFFWPHTRWFGWAPNGRLEQLALLYDEPDPPVLLAPTPTDGSDVGPLIRALSSTLPARVYAHVSGRGLEALLETYACEGPPAPHVRLGLVSPERLTELDTLSTERLGGANLDEVVAFYAQAYPGTWFRPRMLETDRYVGIRDGSQLVCVAGVHVHSPRFGVAVLGNVATDPAARGRGLATAACAHLCRVLRADGIETIALNVHADNAAAIASYTRLGFEPFAEFVEVMLRRR